MVDGQYYRQFEGETFVIQAEGEAVECRATMQAVLQEMNVLLHHGIRVLFVFGKGDRFEAELQTAFGATVHPETSRLVLPEQALPRLQQQRHHVSEEIQDICRAQGIACSMIATSAVRVERRIGHGSTGVATGFGLPGIRPAVEDARLAVVGFGGEDGDGEFLHVPSVSLAADLAVVLGARKLLFLMRQDGIRVPHPKRGSRQLSFADLEQLLCLLQRQDDRGQFAISGKVLPKVHASIRAVCGGVDQVHMVSYTRMLEEILTRTGVGTMIEFRQTHHVDFARPEDLDEIERLHAESQRFRSPHGTPYVNPLDRSQLESLLPQTMVLRHRQILIGKLHSVPFVEQPGTLQIGGFVIAENHQDSQQGQLLCNETFTRLRQQGYRRAVAITGAQKAQALFRRLGGKAMPAVAHPSQRVQHALQRYQPAERDQVELFEFSLD
jgi:acetylglutamate kinase